MRRAASALLAALVALVAVVLVAGSAARADTEPLRRAADYTCQYSGPESEITVPGGLPAPELPSTGGSDPVQVAVQVQAPTSVAPGESIRLSGLATFTFGSNATATNGASVFRFLSDDFGIDVGIGGQQRFLRITDLTTTESTSGDRQVTARWRLPDFLVPTQDADRLVLSVPHRPQVTNPVSSTPQSVAFTGTLQTDSDLQPERDVACALAQGQRTVLGSVRIVPAAAEPTPEPDVLTPATPPAPESPAAPTPPATDDVVTAPEAPGDVVSGDLVAAALASDPIPAPTVASGLRLPVWALLVGGAFVLGGAALGLASSRRLRHLTAAAAVLATLVVLPLPWLQPPRADAATGQAQTTLTCVYEAEGSRSSEVPKDQPTGVAITLDVPDAVRPGDVVTLTGSASVQAPEDIRRQAEQFGYTTLDAISDWFSVGLTIGGADRQVFLGDRWQTGKTAFGNPLVVRGPLSFPSFKVPSDASGSIEIALPRNEVVDRRPPPYRNANTPPRVALELLASVTGNGTSATYIVSCWRDDDGAGVIATIPIVPPGEAAPAPAEGTGGGDSPAAPVDGGTATDADPGAAPGAPPTAGAVPTPGATGTTGSTGDGEISAAGAPLLRGVAADATSTQGAAADRDVTVPGWALLLALLLAVGGYGAAGWNQLRIRALRRTDIP